MKTGAPLAVLIYGIDAWQPTAEWTGSKIRRQSGRRDFHQ